MSCKASDLKAWLNTIQDNEHLYFHNLDGIWVLQVFNSENNFVVGGGQELGVIDDDQNQTQA